MAVPAEVAELLARLHLSHYTHVLVAELGMACVSDVSLLREADLEAIGMKLLERRRLLATANTSDAPTSPSALSQPAPLASPVVATPAARASHLSPDRALLAAAVAGDLEACRAALAQGADYRFTGKEADGRERGLNCLVAAAGKGFLNVVQLLLDSGADANHVAEPSARRDAGRSPKEFSATALMAAAGEGHAEIVRALLEAGADARGGEGVDAADSALMRAVMRGHADVIVLLAPQAEPGPPPPYVETADGSRVPLYPLFLAVLAEKKESIAALVACGWDLNAAYPCIPPDDGPSVFVTALKLAVCNGRAASVEALLVAGANPDETDMDGAPLLWCAAAEGRPEVVRALLDGGARVDAENARDGTSPLLAAVRNGQLECARELVDGGASAAGEGAWFEAIAEKKMDFVRLFVRSCKKQELDAVDGSGFSAIMHASARGQLEVARLLVEAGAALNERCGGDRPGRTPLLLALDGRHIDVATMLVDSKAADVNVRWAGDDWTPLHFAALVKNEELVETLINAGAQTHALTRSGASPMRLLTEGAPELAAWRAHFEAEVAAEPALNATET